uniref:Retrovirus-related Pol polyprotein from transposon TNT 1-94 n=1 Tax=Cajanus cajan TaxID=3821 RepID=A0A151UDF9_CAJCA
MADCKPVCSPTVSGSKLSRNDEGEAIDSTMFKQLIGSLMYLNATRPDIMFSVSVVSRFMENPKETHYVAAKRILRYLRGTTDLGIHYKRQGKTDLTSYCDSDYAGDQDDRKSTSGYVFLLSSGAISWSSRKQPIVTLSTTEAEFVAAAYCVCQGIWIKRILEELGVKLEESLSILCDNSSAIKLSKNPVMHGRSKHIDVRFLFLRNLCKEGIIELKYCTTEEQLADVLTKALKKESFMRIRSNLGMCSLKEIISTAK